MVARKVAGETFLVPIFGKVADMKGLFALNSVASFIWERLDGKADLPALSAAVVAEFEVEELVATTDLREILETFRRHGFIEDTA